MQLANLLDLKKAEEECTTYVPIAMVMQTFSGGRDLAEGLGQIQIMDYNDKRPLRSSLCVSIVTGIPSRGYFAMARQIGYSIGPTAADEFTFWLDQMKQLRAQLSPAAVKTGQKLGILP